MVAVDKRILVVDDEKIVRDSCERTLTDEGYAVRTVASGREALVACRDEPFDVMLIDLRMPDMDGIEVTRMVAKEFPGVRVVVITGYPGRKSAEQAAALGVFEYLEKPLSPQRLNEVTAEALASPLRHASADFSTALSNPALGLPRALSEAVAEESARIEPETPPQPAAVPEAEPEAEPESVVVTAAAGETEVSTIKALGLLAIAPFIGLAFVVFLPVIGYALLIAALGKGVATKLGLMRE
jgi:DNA-binding NtrC family response regulator